MERAIDAIDKRCTTIADVTSFLAWWEEEGQHLAIAMGEAPAAMQVLTIHQAKGLAFDAVLLPFGKWLLDHIPQHPPLKWHSTDQPPFAELGKMPCYYTAQLEKTHYQLSYYKEKHRQYLEQLNLLYVAFTRPRYYLHIWLPRSEKEKIKDTATLIHQLLPTLAEQARTYKEEEGGTEYIWGQLGVKKKDQKFVLTNKAEKRVPASYYRATSVAALQPPGHSAGEWWHELLAHIQHIGDEKALLELYCEQGLIKNIVPYQLFFDQLWQNPQIKDWFSGGWKIQTEHTVHSTQGAIRLDRTHEKERKLILLDYKTGEPKITHKKQLLFYKNFLKKMDYVSIELYLLYIKTKATPFTFQLLPVK